MKFKSGTRRRALEYEKDLVQKWKKNKTFEKSVDFRPVENSYVFYDGPPFISGTPHYGTLLPSIVKDAIPRYQTMKGKRVERVWGWDCHGLPAENFVEKKLGIKDRHEVGTKISLADYITTIRESMIQTSSQWEDVVDRIGRWVDFDGGYKTMDKDYMESIWWAFKELYEKGKIYEGEKVLMYDTQWATPLSKAEVTMDSGAYIDVTDPSIFVKFHLKSGQEYADAKYKTKDAVYALAWTTTPWTIPANTALAVNKDFNYSAIRIDGVKELLIVASDMIQELFKDHEVEIVHDDIKGSDLVGLKYEPLFGDRGENAQKIWSADFVTTESGTGIVHIAPAYGEDDYIFGQKNKIPVIHVLDEFGKFTETEWKGEDVWEINKTIAKTLLERGTVWKIEYIRHEYPHNPRTGNRLMYRAHPSWFMDIEGQRTEMLVENTEHITWFPEHIKHGRFEKTVQTAPDWNLSRDRFWATAMPVWKGIDSKGKEHIKVIGSYAELKELSGVELEDYHRPWVDDIKFEIDGVKYQRIDKVLDCWFESGSMPFAQFHYPFENVEKFEANFPGDFIVEYVGQVRAWFYYVHTVSVGLFGHNAYKNVIVTGTIAGNDGRKMSKSYGNFTDPNELMDKYSADSLRFLLMSSPLLNGEDYSLQDKDVSDVARKLSMIWNMYDFFTMYAEVDKWEYDGNLVDPTEQLDTPLDQWIVSRVHQLVAEVEKYMDVYDIPNAMKPILPFIEDASNWYVRRSRRRFWKAGDDDDKNNAYRTLHYVLVQLSMVLAPFTPFLAEELYQKLTGGESVHLLDWPSSGHINELVVTEMEQVRDYVNQGLSIRAKEHHKVRQPLAGVTVPNLGKFVNYEDILKEELNVKKVKLGDEFELDLVITQELKSEGVAREVIRHIQSARKNAGLNIEDRIELSLITSDSQLMQDIKTHIKIITDETLATKFSESDQKDYKVDVNIDGVQLTISLQKA
ncbi:MAG: isoleucine--tRNA ligase [Candidatus Saccharibacteria bacterium]|nr:isoleucine--tRNA ligase [Candidatus Saccharibacteria bacterium]